MWLKWLPWRYIVRRVARAHGFVDPVAMLARLHRFAEPSEVAAPLELLRAGVVFHARGLMNTGVIQHNLDWVWPYWVERQFDPRDEAFIPRAFSITHVNLTHRNWTAVGVPDIDALPIVDPRGLVTPHLDGWSLDAWVLTHDGQWLIPSQSPEAEQDCDLSDGFAVRTSVESHGTSLSSTVDVHWHAGRWCLKQQVSSSADRPAWLIVSLRPYNPEGVSFIHEIEIAEDDRGWIVDGAQQVRFSDPAEQLRLSNYRLSDVHAGLPAPDSKRAVACNVGMATAAAMFSIQPGQRRDLVVCTPLAPPSASTEHVEGRDVMVWTPLTEPSENSERESKDAQARWKDALAESARVAIPNKRYQQLFETAIRTLVLHSPGEVYPGPYTYKRFWFRDAAFILNALLCVGLQERVRRAIDHFARRQTRKGYFRSQEGEWDSNGEALWIMHRYLQLAGCKPPVNWTSMLRSAAKWIVRKRLPGGSGEPHAGLLPAGFSAEHLGPNDYYYWDDFWSVAGLQAAAEMLAILDQDPTAIASFRAEADDLLSAIWRSVDASVAKRADDGIPASPYRRMDAGAIGSLAVSYPLQLCEPNDARVSRTVEFLRTNCFVGGGFFQDMIHSGINPYLTLHVAQVLLRAGDSDACELMEAVADLASPTGQWPEAIHPHTRGGCMGDGQHVWAAAEWVLMLRNCFVHEEGESLILASGIPEAWLEQDEELSFGPAPTAFGTISVRIEPAPDEVVVRWDATWHGTPPKIEVRLPGCEPVLAGSDVSRVVFARAPVN